MPNHNQDKKILASVFSEFKQVVGNEWASNTEESRKQYVDDYNPGDPIEFVSGGYVAPDSTSEVQEVVKIANTYKVPIWPLSTGKNLAYGGAAPREQGALC